MGTSVYVVGPPVSPPCGLAKVHAGGCGLPSGDHAPSRESIRKWFANSGYRVVSSSISSKCCGMAILITDCLKVNTVIKDDARRFVQALVAFDDDQLSLISLYAPNRNPQRNAFLPA